MKVLDFCTNNNRLSNIPVLARPGFLFSSYQQFEQGVTLLLLND